MSRINNNQYNTNLQSVPKNPGKIDNKNKKSSKTLNGNIHVLQPEKTDKNKTNVILLSQNHQNKLASNDSTAIHNDNAANVENDQFNASDWGNKLDLELQDIFKGFDAGNLTKNGTLKEKLQNLIQKTLISAKPLAVKTKKMMQDFSKKLKISAKKIKESIINSNNLIKNKARNLTNASIVKSAGLFGKIACETGIPPFIALPKRFKENPKVKEVEKEYKETINDSFKLNKNYRISQAKSLGISLAKGLAVSGLATAVSTSFGALIGYLTSKKAKQALSNAHVENIDFPELDVNSNNFDDLAKIAPQEAEILEKDFEIFNNSTDFSKATKEQMVHDFKEAYNSLPAESRQTFIDGFQSEFSVKLSETLDDLNNFTIDTSSLYVNDTKAEEIIHKSIQVSESQIIHNMKSTLNTDFINPVTIGVKSGAAYGAMIGGILSGGILSAALIQGQRKIRNPEIIETKKGKKESKDTKPLNEAKLARIKAKEGNAKVNKLFKEKVKPALESTFKPEESNKSVDKE